MDIMVSDRKVWTAMETRALITLKEEMKPKFQTMKRNRTLWVELSDKLRKHFGHDRTPAQCAVRWKNIMSAYKESRDALRNPRPDSKVCLFFKEVEAILGDPPLPLPVSDDNRLRTIPSTPPQLQSPSKRERSREQKDTSIPALLAELIAKVDAQGAAISRVEKMLAKAGMVGTPPVTDILANTEPLSVPLSDTATPPTSGALKPFGTGDPDVLLERQSALSVPELAVTPDAPPPPDTTDVANDAQAHTIARPSAAHLAHSLPSAEQVTQEVGVTHVDNAEDGVVAAEEVTIPVTGPPLHAGLISPSPVVVAAGTRGADEAAVSDGVGCNVATATSRPVTLSPLEPVVTLISKPTEVQGAEGSAGGSTVVDIMGDGVAKETSKEEPVNKKQKVAHEYSLA